MLLRLKLDQQHIYLYHIVVIMSENKVLCLTFRDQDKFSVLVVKEESITIFKLNVTVTSIWRRKNAMRSFKVSYLHQQTFFKYFCFMWVFEKSSIWKFLNWFSVKSIHTVKSTIWPRLMWQSTVSMLTYIEFWELYHL